MALDGTYAGLQVSIADWLQRDELTSVIPDFIRLAEASFARRPEISVEKDTTINLSTSPTALPSDCREVTDLYYLDAANVVNGKLPINIVSKSELALRAGRYSTSGRPLWASLGANGASLILAPIPDKTYTPQISYITNLVPLATAPGNVNALLTSSPDIYLFGSLLQAEPYLKNDARMATWKRNLEDAIAELDKLNKRRKWSPNTPVIRPRRTLD